MGSGIEIYVLYSIACLLGKVVSCCIPICWYYSCKHKVLYAI
ncbi:hypothetical protein HMPREF3190_01494 [Umbribacter vaginalis]|nr:hypothetical protein HMPREF3190_01494 [Coriobacteriales bacterium DNF00809]